MKLLFTVFSILAIGGCATAPHNSYVAGPSPIPAGAVQGAYHKVESGETLWRISKMYGVDMKALVKANSLRDSSSIAAGQTIFIPGAYKKKGNLILKESFAWPVKGEVISTFGSKVDYAKNKGIDIQAEPGGPVRASRAGRVVFCDNSFKGFGKTVILDHDDNYQTVYAYNSELLVKPGDSVEQNEIIARIGKTGRANVASLHFEIRRDGEPENPLYYLPY